MGINGSEGTDATGVVEIAEYCYMVALNVHGMKEIATQSAVNLGYEIKDADTTLCSLDIEVLCNAHHIPYEGDLILDWYLDYSSKLCSQCSRLSKPYKYIYSPRIYAYMDGMVDWVLGPLATTMIFSTIEYIARFSPGPRICAKACQTLVNARGKYKKLMKDAKDKRLEAVYDRTQYALKISENSMYGVMSFRHYNSYSP